MTDDPDVSQRREARHDEHDETPDETEAPRSHHGVAEAIDEIIDELTSPAEDATVPHPRWQTIAVAIPLMGVVVAGYIAGAFWAKLLPSHPLLLLALSPINRYLLLTTNELDWYSYFSVGMLRHLFPDPLFYLIGFWYGRRAILWAAKSYPSITRIAGEDGTALRDPSRRKILYPLAFLLPNNWVSLLIGASHMPFRIFISLNIAGTLLRLLICRWLGSIFASEIRDIADWVEKYSTWVTVASVVVVGIGIAIQVRRGSGELTNLTHLDELADKS